MKIIILALALASTAFADPSIPRTLYMTHGAPTAASDSYLARIRNTNPTFDVIDYDDDAAAEYIHEAYANTPLPGVYDAVAALGRPVMLADLFRLAVIAREGGFYLDADVRAKESLEPLINDAAVFPLEWWKSDEAFAERHEGAAPRDGLEHFQVGNYAFGAAPGHPLVADALGEAPRRSAALVADRVGVWGLVRRLSGATHAVTDLEVLRTTGPYMLSEVYHGGRLAAAPKYADVTLLRGDDEPPTAARRGPNDWHKFGSFAEHTLAHSWVDDRRLDEEYGDDAESNDDTSDDCEDDAEWYWKKDKKDCDYMAKKKGKKCKKTGEGGMTGFDACPRSCGVCCADDPVWFVKKTPDKDCAWIAEKSKRCKEKGEDIWGNKKVKAKEACPLACDECP